MAKRDYYDILGVSKSASDAEIKSAYRKLAMKYHPDRNPDDAEAEQNFKEAGEAYDALKDPQKRAAYDQFGHAAFDGGMGGPGGGGFRDAGFDFGGSFSDIFEDLFGGGMGGGGGRGRGRRSAMRGADLKYNYEITLEEAFRGKQAEVSFKTSVTCDVCDGSGAEPGSRPQTCPTCGGTGTVRNQQGFFTVERTCPACGGQGQIISDPCKACGGQGAVQKDRTLNVNIPKGVEDGTRIRLAGEGEAGRKGGPAGDLYLFVSVKPHRFFARNGVDVHCTVPISITRAALGGTIEVPTLGGKKARVTVPTGTQSGKQFRLRGQGMPKLQSAYTGDMFVEVEVETPVNLSSKQKKLLEEFEDDATAKNMPKARGFKDKIKDFWDDLTE